MRGVTATALAEEIGDRLKQARLNRDLTQSEVAQLAGIARKTVLNAEKGKVRAESGRPRGKTRFYAVVRGDGVGEGGGGGRRTSMYPPRQSSGQSRRTSPESLHRA